MIIENNEKQKQEELDAMGMKALYDRLNNTTAILAAIDEAKTMLHHLDSTKKAYAEKEKQLKADLAALENKRQETMLQKPKVEAAKLALDSSEDLLLRHKDTIDYDYERGEHVVVGIEVDDDMRIPNGTRAELEAELMGGVRMRS